MLRGQLKERILRIILVNPHGKLTRYRISKLANCSWQWVSELLRKLENKGLTKGTVVIDYYGLTKYWLDSRPIRVFRDYLMLDPMKFLREAGLAYALTTYQAENLIQHYLFPSRTDAYVLFEDREKWHKQIIGAGGLVGSGNLRIMFSDNYVFYGAMQISGHTIVCRPQLVVDLLAEGGPGAEAADLLLQKVTEDALRTV